MVHLHARRRPAVRRLQLVQQGQCDGTLLLGWIQVTLDAEVLVEPGEPDLDLVGVQAHPGVVAGQDGRPARLLLGQAVPPTRRRLFDDEQVEALQVDGQLLVELGLHNHNVSFLEGLPPRGGMENTKRDWERGGPPASARSGREARARRSSTPTGCAPSSR